MKFGGKLGLLGALYFSQGLPYGFFTQALPVMLREGGRSLTEIGFASFLTLPWALKFIWAPLVDRFGLRKHWIVPLQVLSALVMAALASATDRSFLVIACAVLATNALAATQDIATDGLATEMLEHDERGLANGLQVAGYRVGMIAGGGALLIVFDRLGWTLTFGTMAVLLLAATIPIVFAAEPPRPPLSSPERSDAPHFLRLPGTARILALLLIFKFGDAFALGMLRPLLIDRGWSMSDLGVLLGVAGFTAGLLGALAGGALTTRLGRKPALLWFGALQAATVIAYAISANWELPRAAIYAICSAEHFAGGMATAALFTTMMDWCRPGSAATDYTVQASAVVIATGTATALSGVSAQHLGYGLHFAVAAVLAIGALAAVGVAMPEAQHGK